MTINLIATVFGETQVAVSCMEHLLSIGFSINAVVSKDNSVIAWCNDKSIRHLTIDQASSLSHSDYIFSIINPYIISNDILKQIKPIKAINYHDSLLPKYAGINSTTWAILNNEPFHGISWHEIDSKVDTGEIYYQKQIPLDRSETAFSLNLKCTQAALDGFKEVISNITNGTLYGIKQDLSQRTYCGRAHIPTNYAFVSKIDGPPYVNRLLNSLDFGTGYLNPVATVKVSIANTVYILEKKSSNKTLLKINNSNCNLKTLYGREIKKKFDLEQITQNTLTNEEIQSFAKFKQNEVKLYDEIIN